MTAGFTANGIAVPVPAEEPYETRGKLAQVRPADHRVKVEHRLLNGDPAEEILKIAKAEQADLIVLGTHGSTGLARLLLGSVAESVLRGADCPVLTIKTPRVDNSAPANPNVNAAASLPLP
jgi:nucleotide-binding universal stress UspA family protein